MTTRKPVMPAPDFIASPGEKTRSADFRDRVIITHPYWDGYQDCPCDYDTMITVEDAEAFREELGRAIAIARLAVAERQAEARKAAGEAMEAVLDGILGVRGES